MTQILDFLPLMHDIAVQLVLDSTWWQLQGNFSQDGSLCKAILMVCSQDGAPHPHQTKSDRSPQSQKKNTNLYQARVATAITFLQQLPFDV
jgi:hypothetical protein